MQYDRTIAPADHMAAAAPDGYFRAGESAIAAIRTGLAAAGRAPHDIAAAMDFGCGWGRVYRMFPAAFPGARLVAVDLMAEAAAFCARTFGGTAVTSREDFAVDLGPPVDLVWLGSVFTHLPEAAWDGLLDALARHVTPGGTAVLTSHGSAAIAHIEKVVMARNPHLIDAAFYAGMKRDLPRTGFAFTPAPPGIVRHQRGMGMTVTEGHYGFSFATPGWVAARIAAHPAWDMVDFAEAGWANNHDVVTLTRA